MQQFQKWIQLLLQLYSEHAPACSWLLNLLSTTRRDKLLKHCLVESEEKWLREGFSQLLICAIKTLAPHEYSLFPTVVDAKADLLLFSHLEALKKAEAEREELIKTPVVSTNNNNSTNTSSSNTTNAAEEKKEIELAQKSSCVVFMNYLLSLLEYTRRYWQQFHQYFSVINNYCRQGQPERLHLAQCTIPSFTVPLRFVALWLDWYMGQFSPLAKKNSYEDNRVKLGNPKTGESAKLIEYFKCFEGVVLTMKTDSEIPPPTLLGEINPQMDEESLNFFFNKELFVSLIKQGYDIDTNKSIVRHWSFCNHEKSSFFINSALSALKASFDDNKKRYSLNTCHLIKDICEIEDKYQQYRIALIFAPANSKSMGALHLIEKQSKQQRITDYSETVVKCIGILSALIPDEQNPGNQLATHFLYTNLRNELDWIPTFLSKNANIVLADHYLIKWKALLEGKLHKEGVWNSSLDEMPGLNRNIFNS